MQRFRRLFHRPSEIVIGYDEGVLSSEALAEARRQWTGRARARTMPFRRIETDPAAPLLVTFGSVEAARETPPRRACEVLAGALQQASARPMTLMVRFDLPGVIVRGDVRTQESSAVIAALESVPDLVSSARQAAEALPEGAQLITAAYDGATNRWRLQAARGFRRRLWTRRFDPAAGWVEDR